MLRNPELDQNRKRQIVDTVARFLKKERGLLYTTSGILQRLQHSADLAGISESMLDRILLEHEQTTRPQIIQSQEPRGTRFDHWWKYSDGWQPRWVWEQETIKKATLTYEPDPYIITPDSFFISYNYADLDLAVSLRDALNARGYGGFIAHVENKDASDAIEFVGRHLPKHNYYIACLSTNAIKSGWVRHEWRVARQQHKPCMLVINGRDEAFLEILTNVDDSQLHQTVKQDELLRRMSMHQSKENRKWVQATVLPFLLEIKEQAQTAEATLCWPPRKLPVTLVNFLHIRSFDEALSCFRSSRESSIQPSIPSKPEDYRKKRQRKKPERRGSNFPVSLPNRKGAAGARPVSAVDGGPNWNALYRRWILESWHLKMTAREAVGYADSPTMDAHFTGLIKKLSKLDEDTIVIGHWTYESDAEGWTIGYLSFYLESTMEDVGTASDLLGYYRRGLPESNPEDAFAGWALEQIRDGNLS